MFIRLMSEAVEKSSLFTSGLESMYFRSCSVFFSLSSIVHGKFSEFAVVGFWLLVFGCWLKGQGKLFRPLMTAMFRGFLSCFRMKCFFV